LHLLSLEHAAHRCTLLIARTAALKRSAGHPKAASAAGSEPAQAGFVCQARHVRRRQRADAARCNHPTAASRTLEPNQVLILLAARPTGAQWLCLLL
jgi:hypothetical protein